MRLLRSLVFAAALCVTGACATKPTLLDYLDLYKTLENKEFSQLDARYAMAAGMEADASGVSGSDLFFLGMHAGIGRRDDAARAAAALDLARQWVASAPRSVPAAIVMGRIIVRDAPRIADWTEQGRLIAEALKALEAVKENNAQNDPAWTSTYARLKSLDGATPSQVIELTRNHLAGMSEPGEWFFEEIVGALELKSTEALPELRELAILAVQKSYKTRGTSMLAVIYTSAFDALPALRSNPFKAGMPDWQTMDRAYTELNKLRPDRVIQIHQAALACKAQDKNRTAELLDLLPAPSSLDQATWGPWGGDVFRKRCEDWVHGDRMPA